MKARDASLVEGSGCYYCQTMFEPDDEVVFDANFRDYVRVMHKHCSKKNGRILGEVKVVKKEEEKIEVKEEITTVKEIVKDNSSSNLLENSAKELKEEINEELNKEVKPDGETS